MKAIAAPVALDIMPLGGMQPASHSCSCSRAMTVTLLQPSAAQPIGRDRIGGSASVWSARLTSSSPQARGFRPSSREISVRSMLGIPGPCRPYHPIAVRSVQRWQQPRKPERFAVAHVLRELRLEALCAEQVREFLAHARERGGVPTFVEDTFQAPRGRQRLAWLLYPASPVHEGTIAARPRSVRRRQSRTLGAGERSGRGPSTRTHARL